MDQPVYYESKCHIQEAEIRWMDHEHTIHQMLNMILQLNTELCLTADQSSESRKGIKDKSDFKVVV